MVIENGHAIAHSHHCGQITSQTQQNDQASTDNECNDSCHAGQCHFGHCSHVFLSEVTKFLSIQFSVPYQRAELLTLNYSFLNDLSRPPRLS